MCSSSPVVHVIDDDPSFRTAVARLLRASGYEVAVYQSGSQFLDGPLPAEPGCILLDLQMSGLSGLELQDHLHLSDHILPVIFLTGHGDIPTTVRAIKAGAQDFLSKPVSKEALLISVSRALVRYAELREHHERLTALRTRVATLSPREKEVFALVVRGKLNKQIAYALGTSERTIKAHRGNIMKKLDVRSVAQAVSIAERLGMLDSADWASYTRPMPRDKSPSNFLQH